MILLKFWSAFLFYSAISITVITLIWERNIILSLQNSSNFYFYAIGFIFLFPILDDFFDRITSTPEEREKIKKKYIALTERQIIIFSSVLIFAVITLPFLFGYFGWLIEKIGEIGSLLIIVFSIIIWWSLKVIKLWSNYSAIKSNETSMQ